MSGDRKSTRLNSSHQIISYAVFCLKKKNPQAALFSGLGDSFADFPAYHQTFDTAEAHHHGPWNIFVSHKVTILPDKSYHAARLTPSVATTVRIFALLLCAQVCLYLVPHRLVASSCQISLHFLHRL